MGSDCDPDVRRGGKWINRADSLNTGWVKVPVKFPAVAVAAVRRSE